MKLEDKWFYEEYMAYLSHTDNLPKNHVVSINTVDELSEFIKDISNIKKLLIEKTSKR